MAAIAASFMMYAGFGYCASHREWRLGGGAGWRTGAVGIIVAGAALRLVYSGQVELLPEETYYWNYARHLDIGYLDHPPMVAWLIGAGTSGFREQRIRRACRCAVHGGGGDVFHLPADGESLRPAERSGGRGARSDPAVFLSRRHADDTGCASNGRMGSVVCIYWSARWSPAGARRGGAREFAWDSDCCPSTPSRSSPYRR